METAEAISAIRSNWPDERYTMLREALTKAIAALEAIEAGQPAHNSDYTAALRVLNEYFDYPLRSGLDINDMREWCKQRLNSTKR